MGLFPKLLLNKDREHDPSHWSRVDKWFRQSLGKRVLEEEDELIEQEINGCYGYHQVYLGACRSRTFRQSGQISRRYQLGNLFHQQAGQTPDVLCDLDALPLDSDSHDLVIARHVLEFCDHPHLLLREIERITVARGRAVIVGINPWSALGIRSWLSRLTRGGGLNNRLLSAARLRDWLEFSGFDVAGTRYAFHRLPVNRRRGEETGGSAEWLQKLPFGGVYVITAVKNRHGMRPIRPMWQSDRLGKVIPIAAARSMQRVEKRAGET